MFILLMAGCGGITPAPVDERGASKQEPVVIQPGNRYVEDRQEKPIVRAYRPAGQPHPTRQGDPAVVALLDRADQHTRSGRLDSAAATLERALRIQPRSADLWLRLADVRLQQGKLEQAEGLAAKSIALAGDNRSLRAANWKLVARIRSRQGNHAGARAALDKAKALLP